VRVAGQSARHATLLVTQRDDVGQHFILDSSWASVRRWQLKDSDSHEVSRDFEHVPTGAGRSTRII
jgi:hypothetical protein